MNPGQETVRWLKFQLDVRLISITVNNKPYQGTTRVGHISESGIGLMIPANLKKNDAAMLEFTLPKSSDVMQVKAVLRSRTGFRYWFEFLNLSPGQLKEIQRACAAAGIPPAPSPDATAG